MIIPDINLVLYAHDSRSPFFSRANPWWEGLLNGVESVGLPWVVCLAFIRLTTQANVYGKPNTPEEAIETVSEWFKQPTVRAIAPGDRHLPLMKGLLIEARAAAKLVTDAHLAALAMEYGAVLHSHDRDFQRFSGIRLHDPLI
ncbi:MAG TPA: TA system VapC family ribonuclease toxin [Fimbriimonadaceae bacterium]